MKINRNICAKKWMHIVLSLLRLTFYFLLLTSYVLLFTSLTSCGRRGDPVPISPIDETIIKDAGREVNAGEESSISESTDTEITQPDIPTGITALFTGKIVIITWDDISDQGIKLYRVYRSSDDEFILIGDTAAPAFTDVQIKLNTEYHYRVTAVGHSESGTSEEIKIITRLD